MPLQKLYLPPPPQKKCFLVSDTGGSEEKIWVFPTGVEPVTF